MKLDEDAQRIWDGTMTIAQYWESHGYSKAEAKRMEREQIAEAMTKAEEEHLYEQGIWNLYD